MEHGNPTTTFKTNNIARICQILAFQIDDIHTLPLQRSYALSVPTAVHPRRTYCFEHIHTNLAACGVVSGNVRI